MSLDRCCDFRYDAGHPGIAKALADGTRIVRCISLPEMEAMAGVYLEHGIRVYAVYTGESDTAGHYVQRNASALIVGNEPQFAMDGAASWPTGSAEDYINVYSHVANVLVPDQHPGLPLIGAGIWCQDFAKWAMVAKRLPNLAAANCHVYPGPSGQNLSQVKSALSAYRAVRPDLPLICGEYTIRGAFVLSYARAIDQYCDTRLWYGPGLGPTHDLEGTPEYPILALMRDR